MRIFRTPESAASFNFALSISCLVGLAAMALVYYRDYQETEVSVKRAQEAIYRVDNLLQLALLADSTASLYILSARKSVLRSYQGLVARIGRELGDVKGASRDDPAQAEALDAVRHRLERHFSAMSRLMRASESQGVQGAVAELGESGVPIDFDYARSVLSEMRNEQNALLRKYLDTRDRKMRNVGLALLGCVIAGVMLAMWAYAQARTTIATRRASERRKDYLARHDALTGLANRRHLEH